MEQGSKPDYETPVGVTTTEYGRYFYSVVMPDGARVNFNADNVTVADGVLVAYVIKESVPVATFGLGAGMWESFWAASTNDGRPVCVDKAWGWTP